MTGLQKLYRHEVTMSQANFNSGSPWLTDGVLNPAWIRKHRLERLHANLRRYRDAGLTREECSLADSVPSDHNNEAMVLSYDPAQAEELFSIRKNESIKSILASWRKACKALGLDLENKVEKQMNLAYPFERVARDMAFLARESPNAKKKRPRGRPTTIPVALKKKAAKKKADGGTNKDAAKILYVTKHPSPRQVKDANKIIKAHNDKNMEPLPAGKTAKAIASKQSSINR